MDFFFKKDKNEAAKEEPQAKSPPASPNKSIIRQLHQSFDLSQGPLNVGNFFGWGGKNGKQEISSSNVIEEKEKGVDDKKSVEPESVNPLSQEQKFEMQLNVSPGGRMRVDVESKKGDSGVMQSTSTLKNKEDGSDSPDRLKIGPHLSTPNMAHETGQENDREENNIPKARDLQPKRPSVHGSDASNEEGYETSFDELSETSSGMDGTLLVGFGNRPRNVYQAPFEEIEELSQHSSDPASGQVSETNSVTKGASPNRSIVNMYDLSIDKNSENEEQQGDNIDEIYADGDSESSSMIDEKSTFSDSILNHVDSILSSYLESVDEDDMINNAEGDECSTYRDENDRIRVSPQTPKRESINEAARCDENESDKLQRIPSDTPSEKLMQELLDLSIVEDDAEESHSVTDDANHILVSLDLRNYPGLSDSTLMTEMQDPLLQNQNLDEMQKQKKDIEFTKHGEVKRTLSSNIEGPNNDIKRGDGVGVNFVPYKEEDKNVDDTQSDGLHPSSDCDTPLYSQALASKKSNNTQENLGTRRDHSEQVRQYCPDRSEIRLNGTESAGNCLDPEISDNNGNSEHIVSRPRSSNDVIAECVEKAGRIIKVERICGENENGVEAKELESMSIDKKQETTRIKEDEVERIQIDNEEQDGRQEKTNGVSNQPAFNPLAGGGIAAAAAQAAMKRNGPPKPNSNDAPPTRPAFNPLAGGGIAAAAAQAAMKRTGPPKDDSNDAPPIRPAFNPLAGGGIAAAAAAAQAVMKRSTPAKDDLDDAPPTRPAFNPLAGGGIAAAAAQAAMKRTGPAEDDSDNAPPTRPAFNPLAGGGIPAAAAQAAMKRNGRPKDDSNDAPPTRPAFNPLAGGGIAAAAAQAAMKRTGPPKDDSDDAPPTRPAFNPLAGGGIAVAAAQAAMKKKIMNNHNDSDNSAKPINRGIAAAVAQTVTKLGAIACETFFSPVSNPLVGCVVATSDCSLSCHDILVHDDAMNAFDSDKDDLNSNAMRSSLDPIMIAIQKASKSTILSPSVAGNVQKESFSSDFEQVCHSVGIDSVEVIESLAIQILSRVRDRTENNDIQTVPGEIGIVKNVCSETSSHANNIVCGGKGSFRPPSSVNALSDASPRHPQKKSPSKIDSIVYAEEEASIDDNSKHSRDQSVGSNGTLVSQGRKSLMPAELLQLSQSDSDESLRMFSPSSNLPVKNMHLRLQGDYGTNAGIPGAKAPDHAIFSPLLSEHKIPLTTWSPKRTQIDFTSTHTGCEDGESDSVAKIDTPCQTPTKAAVEGRDSDIMRTISGNVIGSASDNDEEHLLLSSSSFTRHDFTPQKLTPGTFGGKISSVVESLSRLTWEQKVARWKHHEMIRMLTAQEPSHHFTKNMRSDSTLNLQWEKHLISESNNLNGFCPSKLLNYKPKKLSGNLLEFGDLPLCLPAKGAGAPSRRHIWPDINGITNILRHEINDLPEDRNLNAIVNLLHNLAEKNHEQFVKCVADIATFASNHLETDVTCLLKPRTNIKTKEAIIEKARRKYGGDLLQVKDIIRGQLIFPDEASLVRTIKHLHKTSNAQGSIVSTYKLIRLKNLFRMSPFGNTVPTDLPTGYRHVIVNLRMPNGFLAEIQLNLKPMFDIEGENGYKLHQEINRKSAWLLPSVSAFNQDIIQKHQGSYNQLLCTCTQSGPKKDILNIKTFVQNQRNNIEILNSKLPKCVLDLEDIMDVSEKENSIQKSGSIIIQNKSHNNPDNKPTFNPLAGGGIATAAAQAAMKRTASPKDDSNDAPPIRPAFNPLAGGGIAAAAAQAAMKRNDRPKDDSDDAPPIRPAFNPLAGGSIAAAAAPAAMKRTAPAKDDSDDAPPTRPTFNPLAGGGIPTAATQAAMKRTGPPKDDSDDAPPTRPAFNPLAGGGIAAAAAQAAMKRTAPAKDDSDDAPPTRPAFNPLAGGGIAAAAAQAAMKRTGPPKDDSDDAPPTRPTFNLLAGGGGIPAAAAQAAMKRTGPPKDDSNDAPPTRPAFNPLAGGGIAAAAAQAAMKKKMKNNQNDSDNSAKPINTLTGGYVAAAAAQAPMRKMKDNQIDSNDTAMPSNPFVGHSFVESTITDPCKRKDRVRLSYIPFFTFSFEDMQEYLLGQNCLDSFLLKDSVLEKLDTIPDLEVSDNLINFACEDIEADPHDVAIYICLHRIYRERFLLTKSQFDKESALKALSTSIGIIDHSNAIGMAGWFGFGKNHDLDRTLERPFEILSSLASFYALSSDWHSSTNVLRSLILRCEQHLPLYHPITITTLVDLAATMMENGETEHAIKFSQRARSRLLMYLNEQEDACVMMQTWHMDSEDQCPTIGGEYYKLVGLDHLAMLKTFALSLNALVKREMMALLPGNHPMKLLYQCFVGDTYSVLASSLMVVADHSSDDHICSDSKAGSETAWTTAGKFYRKALRGWTLAYGVCHPDVMSTSCSLARCLKELGRMGEALKLLSSVVNSSLLKMQHKPKLKSNPCAKEGLVKCIWTLATYTAELKPNQEGRIACMKLLKTAIKLLEDKSQHTTEEGKSLIQTFKKEFNKLMKGKPILKTPKTAQMAFVTV